MTAKENPPSLDCIVPLVAGSQTNYEEYFPGGVARTEYIAQLENLGFGGSSIYYSNPVKNIVWDIVESGAFYPDEIHVPAMMIGGWYDHNVIVMMELFPAIQSSSPPDVRENHRLLMGPWVHGGTGPAYVGSKVQGELEYPEAEKWSDSLARVFLDHWLRDLYPEWNNSPKVQYFQMGENQWQAAPTWPPDGVLEQNFFLHPDQSIQSFPVSQSSGELSFSYDPQDPSPTDGGPTLSNDLTQGPVDQRKKVENRNDILIFTSDPFQKPVRIQGKPQLELMVSSDQPDTDFAVRLTDVYPDGRSMLLVDGIRRMRFRNGFRATDTMVMNPGEMYSVSVEMPDLAHTFMPGHQMRVNITSSNYPRFNRNMNTGKEMYPNLNGDTLVNPRVATNTVFLNAVSPSKLIFPVTDSVFTNVDQNIRNELGVRMIPNPTQGHSRIEFSDNRPGEIEITIYSIPGQKVWNGLMIYSG
ncbi:MAG: CocE/NonD family hydrolase, partial [Bacteroidetes bacterium]|nr:CocE/NonD family hydrolase [Bacteroidota bacterium]